MKIAAQMTVPQRKFLGFCEDVESFARGCDEGHEVVGFTSGQFSIIDVISSVLSRLGGGSLVLSTWTAAGAELDHVMEFIDSELVKNVRWIVDRSFQNRQPALCLKMRNSFGDESIRVQRVHCKFALVHNGQNGVTIQTSANLNKNARIENVSVSSCPVLFSAYSELVEEIFETQMPQVGFESSSFVTHSFNKVVGKKKRRERANPWSK